MALALFLVRRRRRQKSAPKSVPSAVYDYRIDPNGGEDEAELSTGDKSGSTLRVAPTGACSPLGSAEVTLSAATAASALVTGPVSTSSTQLRTDEGRQPCRLYHSDPAPNIVVENSG